MKAFKITLPIIICIITAVAIYFLAPRTAWKHAIQLPTNGGGTNVNRMWKNESYRNYAEFTISYWKDKFSHKDNA